MDRPRNRPLHSRDPLDPFGDPLDLSNANGELGAGGLDVRALRKKMRLTQRQFAGWFGFPIATLKHWERGNRQPTGTALVLLHVIRENPRVVRQAVRKARMWSGDPIAEVAPRTSFRAPPHFGERQPALRPRGPRRRR